MSDWLVHCMMLWIMGAFVYAIGDYFRHTFSLILGMLLMSWALVLSLYWVLDLGLFGGSLPLGGS